ncbi:hypothetical protein BD410DRAFT_101642 [Rickenella mellea]|uniref:Kinetochore protein Nuf2 N-terminal domain-containing protein n=1 Tax=Rickenella mellea TaxID=50990 RepID=A0A4Y7PJK7_9AGAM|nr:hypothetical protein BD410DRAFT_101642 [Rickenella mellea]
MSGQTGFWYPSMDVDEIVSSIRGWGLEITNAQIQAPTAEVVQAIYSLFLSQITGLTADTLEEPAMRALGVVEVNQELYANALNMHLLLHHIQRIAMAARVQDFSMKDLVAPETQRTRLILSAFVNFIRFAEEREVFLKELRDKSLRTIEERDRMKQQVEELRAAIEKQKLEAEKSRPQCSALKQENEELRKGLLDTKGDLNKVVDEVAELRDKKKALSRQKVWHHSFF